MVSEVTASPGASVTVTPVDHDAATTFEVSSEQRSGDNLFFGFQRFNIGAGDTVEFVPDAQQTPHTHIIGRIDDSGPSSVAGRLDTTRFDAADLYLFNPHGFVFSNTASLDLSGGLFVGATARLEFADGSKLDIDTPANLSASAPSGFGSPDRAGAIRLEGGQLSVPAGQRLQFTAGAIELAGGQLFAPQGEVGLLASGEVSLAEGPEGLAGIDAARVRIDAGKLSISGKAGGDTDLFAYLDNQDRPAILASERIDITAREQARFDNGAIVRVSGSAPSLRIDAPAVSVARLASLSVDSNDAASGEGIVITTDQLSIVDGGQLLTAGSGSRNQANDIRIEAGRVTISGLSATPLGVDQVSEINSSVSGTGGGSAGAIIVQASESLSLADSGRLFAITSALDQGSQGGDIRVQTGRLSLTSQASIANQSTGAGSSGNISIQAGPITLDDSSSIDVTTHGADAGVIDITFSGLLKMGQGASISTSALADDNRSLGNGGNITVTGTGKNLLLMQDGARITAETARGHGGDIVFNVQSVLRDPPPATHISANANNVEGEAGKIEFNTPDVDATSGTLQLPQSFADVSELVSGHCTAPGAGQSRFHVRGREGLPASPDALLAANPIYPLD